MNANMMAQKIRAWELRHGEGFVDYYMHDHVKYVSWAFWLLGKGYSERANILIDKIQAGEKYIDPDLLFELHSNDVNWIESEYMKDVMLWAEFLTASNRYLKAVTEWFDNYPE